MLFFVLFFVAFVSLLCVSGLLVPLLLFLSDCSEAILATATWGLRFRARWWAGEMRRSSATRGGPAYGVIAAFDDDFFAWSSSSDGCDGRSHQIMAQVHGAQATDLTVQLNTAAENNHQYSKRVPAVVARAVSNQQTRELIGVRNTQHKHNKT